MIGFGGGCHWCTEAVFQELRGVKNVRQGWISSTARNHNPSEAIMLEFDPSVISLQVLVTIHLLTHASTSAHSMRGKYRSAIYFTNLDQEKEVIQLLKTLQREFDKRLVTQCLPLIEFKLNEETFLNYYQKRPQAPFCKRYISPKLELIRSEFSDKVRPEAKLTTGEE